jgi:hypothetical protein
MSSNIVPLTSTELSSLSVSDSPVISKNALEVLKSPNPNFQSLFKRPDADKVKDYLFTAIYVEMKMVWPAETETVLTGMATSFALYIEDDKPDWKINDIYLFFRFVIRNQVNSKQYRKLDMSYLGLMVGQYEEYKAEARERLMGENRESKFEATQYPQQYIDSIKQVLEATKEKPVAKVPRLKTPAEIMVQGWIGQFDTIKLLQCLSGRFIYRFRKYWDVSEWLHHKNKQREIVLKRLERRKRKLGINKS